jgi:hypothetical protein
MASLTLDRGSLLLSFRPVTSRLKAGVLVDAETAEWVGEFLAWLRAIDCLDVQVFSAAVRPKPAPPAALFERIYSRSRSVYDPLGARAIPAEIEVSPWSAVSSGAPVDLVLWLSASQPTGCTARFGALSLQLGAQEHLPYFWDEPAREQVLTDVTVLWHDVMGQGDDKVRALRTAQLRTHQGLDFTRNAAQPLAAACQMLASFCLEILVGGEEWLGRARQIPERQNGAYPATYPSNADAALFLARKLARSMRLRSQVRGRTKRWLTALRSASGGEYRIVPTADGSQMADPFLVEDQGRTFLYFEQIPAGTKKGRLACLEILDGGSFTEPVVILDRPDHISYPCVFRDRGEYYMIPETGASGRVDLFRATRFPYEFELAHTYVTGVGLSDTTPVQVQVEGIWYFFTTTEDPFMQTLLFWSDRLDGEWKLHPQSPVSCSAAHSRSAGAIAMNQGRLLRPTQDCSVRYGYAMAINEIVRLTPTEFEERKVDVILPTWRPGLIATHTINRSSKFEVIDGAMY